MRYHVKRCTKKTSGAAVLTGSLRTVQKIILSSCEAEALRSQRLRRRTVGTRRTGTVKRTSLQRFSFVSRWIVKGVFGGCNEHMSTAHACTQADSNTLKYGAWTITIVDTVEFNVYL